MTADPPSNPLWAQALADLTTLGLRAAQAVVAVMEVEKRAVAAASHALPVEDEAPASLQAATLLDLAIAATGTALTTGTPRIATLAQSFERLARSVRRTVALGRRIERGWPRPIADDRRALTLRHAARATRDAIRTRTDSDTEAAERLFADLDARLDDPAFERDLLERPIKEMVRMLCQAIGLPADSSGVTPATRAPTPHHQNE